MIKEAINKAVNGQDLTEKEASDVMAEIMGGEATDAQIAAFITALRMKGETISEITGCARVMRRFATPIRVKAALDIDRDDINIDAETILDTCGTGGDGTSTFNISTATAFVVASCGLTVAKHGNRSVSSACGSADVLEALGVNINIAPEKVEECISKIGIGFLFATSLHGAMKHAINPRRQIGIRTIFNVLGPLTNPAGATAQVLGVYSRNLVEMLAQVLSNLGSKRAWV
ncbi:MAG: anthranilate phosphoribosyltransferase, partial [Elusimicrobia bacterium RIFOXYA1_FULL_47_7]